MNSAIASKLKGSPVRIVSSLFAPEFVSDGLFKEVWNGQNKILSRLELGKFLDGLILTRQEVRYTENTELANTVTANMELEVMIIPITRYDDARSVAFSAIGVGFSQNDARKMAEERILKELSKDNRLSLDGISQ